MRTPPTSRKRRIARAADAVRAVKGGYSGHYAAPPARTNVKLYGEDSPLGEPGFRGQGAAAGDHRRLCARQGPARAPGLGQPRRHLAGGRDRARRRRDLSRRPPAGARQRLGRGRRRRPAGDRQRRLRRPRRLRAFHRHRHLAGRGRRRRAPGADQSRSGAGAGRRNGRGARPGLAGRHAARGGRPRARRRFQPQEDLGLRRPDGPARRRQGRHRGRRRHHGAAPRLALDRRRGHADQPHRADRGRHSRRLHAGPAERAADGHEADRQRPARELRPRADAAHDQHLHARRHARSRTRSSPR